MIWFLMLPLEIAFTLLALILAPVLPLFARDEYGFSDNANAMRTEPRLPSWLSWFMTPDNSLRLKAESRAMFSFSPRIAGYSVQP